MSFLNVMEKVGMLDLDGSFFCTKMCSVIKNELSIARQSNQESVVHSVQTDLRTVNKAFSVLISVQAMQVDVGS